MHLTYFYQNPLFFTDFDKNTDYTLFFSLKIIMNILWKTSMNIIENTTLKYYHKQVWNKKPKSMGGVMNFFSKKSLGHKIFCSMVPWDTKCLLKNF